jgi:hypothetical protein
MAFEDIQGRPFAFGQREEWEFEFAQRFLRVLEKGDLL